jgi:hypothetical protein
MFRKISLILGIAMMLSSMPISVFGQTTEPKTEEHTGVKRTVNKAGQKTKRAAKKVKATTKRKYKKVKSRVKNGDAKEDAQERK